MVDSLKSIECLDLLSANLTSASGVLRQGTKFLSDRPWATADFGEARLRRGWWRLDVEGQANATVEVRLESRVEPLLCLRGRDAKGVRFRLDSVEPTRISLLISPWPGEASFTCLKLRRLNRSDEVRMYCGLAMRLRHRGQWFTRLGGVLARLLTGRSFGVRMGRVPEPKRSSYATESSAPATTTLERHEGLVAILAAGDRLDPRAIEIVRSVFDGDPELQLLHADAWEGGRLRPSPSWDRVLAMQARFPQPPYFLRSCAVDSDATDPRSLAAIAANPSAVARLPLPLVNRNAPLAWNTGTVPAPSIESRPTVSIVIPTKNRTDLLSQCLASLEKATNYDRLEIVIVNNGSTNPDLPGVLDRARKFGEVIEIIDNGTFNFSRLVNSGVKRASGEIVVMLNDDIEAADPTWLERLVESACKPEVGAVGARLIYADGAIQHAGVVLGIGGVCGHLWRGMLPEEAAATPFVSLPSERAAVTGACIAIRRAVYELVGGMDEAAFPVTFNDVDLCLRLRAAGYCNVYRGDAVLVHHESQSRGADAASIARSRRLEVETRIFVDRWHHVFLSDPYNSPALDMTREDGQWHPSLDPGE
jgi:GT2 family glycosyltransferase